MNHGLGYTLLQITAKPVGIVGFVASNAEDQPLEQRNTPVVSLRWQQIRRRRIKLPSASTLQEFWSSNHLDFCRSTGFAPWRLFSKGANCQVDVDLADNSLQHSRLSCLMSGQLFMCR